MNRAAVAALHSLISGNYDMNEFTPVIETAPARPAASNATPAPSFDVRALAQVLAEIEGDSQRQPQQYLLDTVVPHGGE
jgi:hypothetical protein